MSSSAAGTERGEVLYAVIGTGMMGREHIANLNTLPGARVVAIADPDATSLALGQQAARLDDAACFPDYREMLEEAAYDVVVVATPNHTHADVMVDVLPTGAHILVEKPLGTTVAECDRIIEAARRHRGIVWMGLEYRYKPAIARLVDRVHGGAIGRTRMVSIREHRFPFLEKVDHWNRFRRNTGGTLVEKCCHFFDLMTLILEARPVRVYASGAQDVNHLDEVYDGETPDIIDNAFVIVDYDNGARALLDLCMFAEGSKNEQELVAVGDTGKIEAFVSDSLLRVSPRSGSVTETFVADDRILHQGLHEGSSFLEHLDFLETIRNGGEPKVTLEDGRRAVAVGVAAHRSIDEGRPVELSEVV